MEGLCKIGKKTVTINHSGRGYVVILYKGFRLAEEAMSDEEIRRTEKDPKSFRSKMIDLEDRAMKQARKTMKEVVKHEERGLTMKDFVCGK